MWRLSTHSETLGRLYAFKEAALEARYQDQSRALGLFPISGPNPIRLHGYIVLVYSLISLLTSTHAKLIIWLYIAVMCTTAVLIACTHIPGWLRCHVAVLHALYCCLVGVINAAIVFLDPDCLRQEVTTRWIPELLTLSSDASDLLAHFNAYITSQLTNYTIHVSMLENIALWASLAMVGLQPCTVLANAATTVTLAVCVATVPGLRGSDAVCGFLGTVVVGCIFLLICVVLERARRSMFLAETLLGKELYSSQQADSILNHTLKNTLADVAANLEVFLAGQAGPSLLQDCIACLRRGMRSCKERQVYLQLVAGDYVPVLNQINVKEFGEELVTGRCMVYEPLEVTGFMDQALLNLILENAISNAFKHGHPNDPNVKLVVRDITRMSPQLKHPGWCRLQFSVFNVAHPHRPPLTRADTERLFKGKPESTIIAVAPTLSDRIGISHCVIAANLAGITLSLTQEAGIVTFSACLDVQTLPVTRQATDFSRELTFDETRVDAFPTGLRFFCIDDSPAARRLLEFHLKQWCTPGSVTCLGAVEEDVEKFVPMAMEGADVVIIDQHLEFSRTYHGTDLILQLRDLGFEGLICVRSANDSPEDRRWYWDCGAHCAFGKDMLGPRMVRELKLAYLRLQGAHRSLSTSQRPSGSSSQWTSRSRTGTMSSTEQADVAFWADASRLHPFGPPTNLLNFLTNDRMGRPEAATTGRGARWRLS